MGRCRAQGRDNIIGKVVGEEEGGTRLPFFCGDPTPRELRVRAARTALYLLPLTLTTTRCAIGTDVKHRRFEWRAAHRAPPCVGAT